VTVALCGHWEHEGACRWPHRTSISARAGQSLQVRVVFVADDGEEPAVRGQIRDALDEGRLASGPRADHWTVLTQGRSELRPEEEQLAHRLLGT